MKVTYRKHCAPPKEYRDVKRGEVFRTALTGTKLFIKADFEGFSGKASIELNTGTTFSFPDSQAVQLVNCEVVVE